MVVDPARLKTTGFAAIVTVYWFVPELLGTTLFDQFDAVFHRPLLGPT